jgi:hypothetical protein
MFGLFRHDPVKKWRREHEVLLTRAFQAQRNGDIRSYSTLTAEAEAIKAKIDAAEKDQSA